MSRRRRIEHRRSHSPQREIEESAEQEDSVRRLKRLAGLADTGGNDDSIAHTLARLLGRGYRDEGE